MSERDSQYMKRCFYLAKKGIGSVSPNPLVGCVIVKNDQIIGEGYHEFFGGFHAEAIALQNCIENPEGATLYVNLEPCCHEGKKTPPCVPSIISNKIKKVVISNLDPNTEVNGKGVENLRNAGIEVVTGIEEEEGAELNKFFFKYIKHKLPYVTLKIAKTLDGKITEEVGSRAYITGDEANKFVHHLRSKYDAVLVGANTVGIDNPQLTVRFADGRNPYRIILDSELIAPMNSNIFSDDFINKTWVFTGKDSNPDKINELRKRSVRIIELDLDENNNFDLNEILKILGEDNISSLLVEGGQKVFSQFIESGLYDELVFLTAPKLFGKGLDAVVLDHTVELKLKELDKLGNDFKVVFVKKD